MKTLTSLFILLLMVAVQLPAQELNQTKMDEKYDTEILFGYCDKSGMKEGEFGIMYDEYFKTYEPDMGVIKALRKYKDEFDVVVVLGTWCHDSQMQVPRFFKVTNKAKINDDLISIIAVDGTKKAGEIDIDKFNISRVPTFIFYKNGTELGRIIETPANSIEEDMLLIIEG